MKGRILILAAMAGVSALAGAQAWRDGRIFPDLLSPATAPVEASPETFGPQAKISVPKSTLPSERGATRGARLGELFSPLPFGAPGRDDRPAPVESADLDRAPVASIPPTGARSGAAPGSDFRLAYAPPDLWRGDGLPSLAPGAALPAPPQESQQQERQPETPLHADSRAAKGPIYIRIFKREGRLEIWSKNDGRYGLRRAFPICKYSGELGPKQRYADYQSPEGFYSVSAKQLKPNSAYFRAFDVGYPNAYDKQHGRGGSLIMVHGACKSVGCFAMTDKSIGEIYAIVEAALKSGGQKEVPVHIFPFRMSEAAIARESRQNVASLFSAAQRPDWSDFWRNLKEGYDLFEKTGEPPVAYACKGRYRFNVGGAGCQRVAGW